METSSDSLFQENTSTPTERPEFLKILCILSFICCGLMILGYMLGSFSLGLSQATIDEIWPMVIEKNKYLEDVDSYAFFQNVGKLSIYCLIANVVSLIGVIMMWRLDRLGFFLYAAAELITNFLSLNIDLGQEHAGNGSMFFTLAIDLVFIALYFVNLKHMNKRQAQ